MPIRKYWERIRLRFRNRERIVPRESRGVSRRTFVKVALGLGLASLMESCAPFVTRKYGFDREFPTALPNSARQMIESVPGITQKEIAFIKEEGRHGLLVGSSITRESGNTNIRVGWWRKARSSIHTHRPIQQNPLLQMYPSPIDIGFLLNRLQSPRKKVHVKTMHIAPISTEGKVMGYVSVHVGKKWQEMEQTHPDIVEGAVKQYSAIAQAFANNQLTRADFQKTMAEFWNVIGEVGLRIRFTPMPEFVFKDGYFQPK